MTGDPYRMGGIVEPTAAPTQATTARKRRFFAWNPADDHPHTESVDDTTHAGAAMLLRYTTADRIAVCDSTSGVTKFYRVEMRTEETSTGARRFLQATEVP